MICTLSKKGRIIRGILGVAIIAAGVHFQSWWGALGAVFILGAVLSFCPIDGLCRSGKDKSEPESDKKCGGHCK
ncbi:MAG: DUF2892 domain-containing protein [Candidatus Omnitrophota bacterium]|nr:DUF2892 domain-containing protein [Candidatus Omnitrophota bacterium]